MTWQPFPGTPPPTISVGVDPAAIALAHCAGALRAVRRAVIAETTVLTHGIVALEAAVPFTRGCSEPLRRTGNNAGATRRAIAPWLTPDGVAIIVSLGDAWGAQIQAQGVTPNTSSFGPHPGAHHDRRDELHQHNWASTTAASMNSAISSMAAHAVEGGLAASIWIPRSVRAGTPVG